MSAPLLIGNWKSNTSLEEAKTLAQAVRDISDRASDRVAVGVAVPYPWLIPVREILNGSAVWVGAQDVSATDNGAFTGDVSAAMLKDVAQFTIIGHSERRALHGETDAVVKDKIARALENDLDVVLCVGEVLEQRESGEAEEVVKWQLLAALEGMDASSMERLAVAYEPVWAIGTGKAATADDAAAMCTMIRNTLDERFGDSTAVYILYGGSANDSNAGAFLAADNVSGLLIGGASLKPDAFGAMVQTAANDEAL